MRVNNFVKEEKLFMDLAAEFLRGPIFVQLRWAAWQGRRGPGISSSGTKFLSSGRRGISCVDIQPWIKLCNQEKVTKLSVIWYIGARKAENKSFVVSLTISRFLEGFIEAFGHGFVFLPYAFSAGHWAYEIKNTSWPQSAGKIKTALTGCQWPSPRQCAIFFIEQMDFL